jgi:hypothetical protein
MHRGFGSEECGYSRALVSRPSAERRSRTEREPGPSATTREAQYGCRLRSVVSPPRSTQVGFTRLASSNCRSRAGPRSVSRCARPGHERSADRERTAGRSLNSRCQTAQSSLFPRRVSAPGFVFIPSHPSLRGAGGAPTGALVLLSRLRGATSALVRRGAPHDAGRSPLGAPPWRFSAGGRASISGIASGSVQRAPRSQVVMPGGRCPGPPEPAVTSRGRRTPLPAPPSGSSLEDAPS